MLASIHGHVGTVQRLLAMGAEVNARDDTGTTSLMLASLEGHQYVMRELHSAGGDPLEIGFAGQTAVAMAGQNGHVEAARYLYRLGADVNVCGEDGRTALMVASMFGHARMVRELRAMGADVDAVDSGQGTALMDASMNGNGEALLELIGADATRRHIRYDFSALEQAIKGRHWECVALLLAYFPDTEWEDVPCIDGDHQCILHILASLTNSHRRPPRLHAQPWTLLLNSFSQQGGCFHNRAGGADIAAMEVAYAEHKDLLHVASRTSPSIEAVDMAFIRRTGHESLQCAAHARGIRAAGATLLQLVLTRTHKGGPLLLVERFVNRSDLLEGILDRCVPTRVVLPAEMAKQALDEE